MFKFITNRSLLVNILFGIFIILLLVVLFFLGLGFITNHGKTETVPNITGKNIEAARLLLEAKGFTVEVADSIYIATEPKLNVIKQSPEADAIVKKGRTVYLTINKQVPNQTTVPSLVGMSFKSALLFLKQSKLELGDTTYVASFAKNTVEEMKLNGYKIAAGSRVSEGTKIDLVISSGPGEQIDVPNVLGLTYNDALSLIRNNQIQVGLVLADAYVKDTLNAFVYKQTPDPFFFPLPNKKINTKIRIGQLIDIWLSTQKPTIDSLGLVIDSTHAIPLQEQNPANQKPQLILPNGAKKTPAKPIINKSENKGSEYD